MPRPAEQRLLAERRVEEPEPARQVGLDRELLFELVLEADLLCVVTLLFFARRDEGPERAALEAVDERDRLLAALEGKHSGEQLPAEAARRELRADEMDRRDEILEITVADDEPLEAVLVGAPAH